MLTLFGKEISKQEFLAIHFMDEYNEINFYSEHIPTICKPCYVPKCSLQTK